MSMELQARYPSATRPDRAALQGRLDHLGAPVHLPEDFDLATVDGFAPATVAGAASGCELYREGWYGPDELVAAGDAELKGRWGSDATEGAFAHFLLAAVVDLAGGVIWDPETGEPEDVASTVAYGHELLAMA